uniref:P/Homo B domain-containing protein n=1 Tax=Heterorhabditis bacteriophora TaxID=37862 RepID=A0A1I7XDN8_HETBA
MGTEAGGKWHFQIEGKDDSDPDKPGMVVNGKTVLVEWDEDVMDKHFRMNSELMFIMLLDINHEKSQEYL